MREKILRAIGSIPADSLYNYIQQGLVTFQDLINNGLTNFPEKRLYLEEKLSAGENDAWNQAASLNTVEAYDKYLSSYPSGAHVADAKKAILELDDTYWQELMSNLTEPNLDKYLRLFPTGKHVNECKELKADLPWLETKAKNTLVDYEDYERRFPGKHTAEIKQAKEDIIDTNDWEEAVKRNTIEAYKEYQLKHSHGLYFSQAEDRIHHRSLKDIVLDDLKKDDNCYSSGEIKQKVNNGVLTWEDLESVFSPAQVKAIRDWENVTDLPYSQPPKQLQRDSTEIYFWGTKGTGKTCAIGAVLSAAKKGGKLIALDCEHRVYLDQLSNLFAASADSICNLPNGNNFNSVSEMTIELIDNKDKKHKMTFIDLAGEAVTGVYKLRNNIPLLDKEKETIEQILSYLRDPYNNKMHFFVVEYGAANRPVKELEKEGYNNIWQGDILSDLAKFIEVEGGLNKSTIGVYALVSKCDMIDVLLGTKSDQRPELAYKYITTQLAAFWNQIKLACKKANVKEVKTIAFSIGDVYAQNLCVFEESDSKKIIDQLLLKTKTEPEGFWKWLFN